MRSYYSIDEMIEFLDLLGYKTEKIEGYRDTDSEVVTTMHVSYKPDEVEDIPENIDKFPCFRDVWYFIHDTESIFNREFSRVIYKQAINRLREDESI